MPVTGAQGCHHGLVPITGHGGVTAGSCLPPRAARWRPRQHSLPLLIGMSRGLLPFMFPPGDQRLRGTVFKEEEPPLCQGSPCQSDGLCHGFAWPLSCVWFGLSKSRHIFICLKSLGAVRNTSSAGEAHVSYCSIIFMIHFLFICILYKYYTIFIYILSYIYIYIYIVVYNQNWALIGSKSKSEDALRGQELVDCLLTELFNFCSEENHPYFFLLIHFLTWGFPL